MRTISIAAASALAGTVALFAVVYWLLGKSGDTLLQAMWWRA